MRPFQRIQSPPVRGDTAAAQRWLFAWLLALAVWGHSPSSANAATVRWAGATAGEQDWSVPGNWIPARVPGVDDDVLITGDVKTLQVVLRTSAKVRSLVNEALLRPISRVESFTTLEVVSNLVNRGELRLESERSDRITQVIVGPAGALENDGVFLADPTNLGRRIFKGNLHNRGVVRAGKGITLEINNTESELIQSDGALRAEGTLSVAGGRVRMEGGLSLGDVRLFNPDLSIGTGMTVASEVTVLGVNARLRGNASPTFSVHLNTDFDNFTRLTVTANGVNLGRIVLDSTRSDRWTRLECVDGLVNEASALVEILAGAGGDRVIQGDLLNRGRIQSGETATTFLGTYRPDGGVVVGDVTLINATVIPVSASAAANSLRLMGGQSVLKGDIPVNLTLRLVSDFNHFSVLTVDSNIVNRGELSLESLRSDRTTRLVIPAGGAFVNEGGIFVRAENVGGRVIQGAVDNRGILEVANGIVLQIDNTGAVFNQRGGRLTVLGGLQIFRGRLNLLRGTVSGVPSCFDVEHFAAQTMIAPVTVDVLGVNSQLVANESTAVTYHITSDFSNFTTLRLQQGAVNRGRIVHGAGRSDRDTRILFADTTNVLGGVIEVMAEAGGARTMEGTLVNQGQLIATNHPVTFRGTYVSDAGLLEGSILFFNSSLRQRRDAEQTLDFLLYGGGTVLETDNLPNHHLHVISDFANFSALQMGSNVVNHGVISLESERSDRTATLRGADGVIRNAVDGLIRADGINGGLRQMVGALQNQGTVAIEAATVLGGDGAQHRNSGLIRFGAQTVDIDGASFVNLVNGRLSGAGLLDVRNVDFSNAGRLMVRPSPGLLRILGNVRLQAGGTVDLNFFGIQGAGVGNDALDVKEGRATLGGRLNARFKEGFVPGIGLPLRVVTAGQATAERFAALASPQILSNRFLEFAYTTSTTVDLIARAGTGSNQPPAIVLHPESQSAEQDSDVSFIVEVEGTGPFTYQWRFNGTPIPGGTRDSVVVGKVGQANVGGYDVVVTSPYGSATSERATLRLTPRGAKSGKACDGCDFGDAPDSYGTSLSVDGARHPNAAPTGAFVGLGARVDLEPDSNGNNGASLDDGLPVGQGDDEDGVVFLQGIKVGQVNEVAVAVRKSGYEFAFLNAWIDFNGDGIFGNGSDHILDTVEVHSGLNLLPFNVPSTALVGDTYARFRLVGVNDASQLERFVGPTGLADNGEVEDYKVTITSNGTTGGGGGEEPLRLDFGDAPNSYGTTLAKDGARHRSDALATGNLPFVILGTAIDLETNGIPTVGAVGDDVMTPVTLDDEDGVTFLNEVFPGTTARIQIVVTARGYTNLFLNAWIDYAQDGTFTNQTDQIATGLTVAAGTNVISVVVPTNAVTGMTYARFRITGDTTPNSNLKILAPTGSATNGEVEDHPVTVQQISYDFGDAPESQATFKTLLANQGPRHRIVEGVFLGKRIDGESDGKPTAQARGDDNTSTDDEDGVAISGPLTAGAAAVIEVTASTAGKLEGWIDFNGNRSWTDAGENVFASIPINAGLNQLAVSVPATAFLGDVFARFRFSTRGGYGLTGEADDGEVEDFKVTIEPSGQCTLSCSGSDFWLAFPGNQFPDPAFPLLAQLRILGTAGNTVTVDMPGLGSSIVATIGANGIANVVLPNAVDLGDLNDSVLNRGIHVTTSGKPVSVYAISRVKYSSDGYMGLPTSVVGTDYVVGAYPNLHTGIPELSGSQFVITATQPNTSVTITPAFDTGLRIGQVPYTLMLTNAGDCYQLRNTNDAPADLTGTRIESDQPVAVFGGHQCTDVNSTSQFFCDYLVEQIPPVNRLGMEFFAAPFATRSGGDTVRLVAAHDQTTLTLDGTSLVLTNKGDVHTFFRTTPTWIQSDKPVYAAQYASSSDVDDVKNADPFMITLPGRSQFTTDHTFVTAGTNFPNHYITVIASELTSSVTLDGVAQSPAFTDIGDSGFRYAHLSVTQGIHTLSATRPLGVLVYGWSEYESYGWPACLFFGDTTPPVISVPNTTLVETLPRTGDACVLPVPELRQTASVSDNCRMPLDIVLHQDPAPGTSVGVGTNKIVLTVTDAAGNTGTTVVDFVVVDSGANTGYTLQCPAGVVAPCQGEEGAIVRFSVLGLHGCTPVAVETIPASGSFFPRGVTQVVARIVDGGVVRAECTFEVAVTCRKRLVLSIPPPQPGGPSTPTELILDFDPGENIVEVADSLGGPWQLVPNAQPGMRVTIEQVRGRFYRIR